MYRILFIDEEKETFDDFLDYVEASAPREALEVITQFPLESLEEMIDEIFKINPDALLIDFRLNEIKTEIKYNVPYDGVELVEELLKVRTGFPCFILTAFDDLAINASEDVNKIYIKNILHNNKEEIKARANFISRVISQIDHYKLKIRDSECELLKLIELRRSGKATMADEERMIELDQILEKSIDAKHSLPADFKSLSNDDRLNKIISKVDEILKKINETQL